MADESMAENIPYQDYNQQQNRNVSVSRTVHQSETSISILRDDIQRPLATLQQNIIQGNTQDVTNINMPEFINELEDYVPTIPDAVTLNLLRTCGCDCTDPRVVRLVALATQKYVSDIVLDTMQQARMKGVGQTKKGTKETRYCIASEILEPVLKEYGITFVLPPYMH